MVDDHNQFQDTTSSNYYGEKIDLPSQWILGIKNVSHMWGLGIGTVKTPMDLHKV